MVSAFRDEVAMATRAIDFNGDHSGVVIGARVLMRMLFEK